jgi:HEPN domain-containing protein
MSRNPWFDYAREDLQAAEVLCSQGIHRLASFHAQQSVEKLLKGLLWNQKVNPPRTHDLVFLYQKVKKRYPRLSLGQEELEFLNGLYIESRYPADLGLLPEGEPTAADARRALAIAREILGKVREVLGHVSPDSG